MFCECQSIVEKKSAMSGNAPTAVTASKLAVANIHDSVKIDDSTGSGLPRITRFTSRRSRRHFQRVWHPNSKMRKERKSELKRGKERKSDLEWGREFPGQDE